MVGTDGKVTGWRNDDPRKAAVSLGDISPADRGNDPDRVYFADLDGDGKDDYIRILMPPDSPTGIPAMRMSRNTSSGGKISWGSPTIVANNLIYEPDLYFTDLDGDGRDDLITLDRMSFPTAWQNKGKGMPTPGGWEKVEGFGTPGRRAAHRSPSPTSPVTARPTRSGSSSPPVRSGPGRTPALRGASPRAGSRWA